MSGKYTIPEISDMRELITVLNRRLDEIEQTQARLAVSGDLDMQGNRIVNLGEPIDSSDAATRRSSERKRQPSTSTAGSRPPAVLVGGSEPIPIPEGLAFVANGVETRILNEYDVGLDYGIIIRREADPSERLFLCPTGVFLKDDADKYRVYLAAAAGGAGLYLYDTSENQDIALFINANTLAGNLTLGGSEPLINLASNLGVIKVAGQQVLGQRGMAVGVPSYYLTETAGSSYTSNEQTMLANLKAGLLSIGNVLATLISRLDSRGHYLIAGDGT